MKRRLIQLLSGAVVVKALVDGTNVVDTAATVTNATKDEAQTVVSGSANAIQERFASRWKKPNQEKSEKKQDQTPQKEPQ
jgi:hypothetical protein